MRFKSLRNHAEILLASVGAIAAIAAPCGSWAGEAGVPRTSTSAVSKGSGRSAQTVTRPQAQPSAMAVAGQSHIVVGSDGKVCPQNSASVRVKNTGIDSVILANSVAQDASHKERVERAKKNAAITTKYADHNVDVAGCKLIKKNVNASCYGLLDGFTGGPTLIGPFNPTLMTAAFPDSDQGGNILVVRVPSTNTARAVTVTDWGPAKKLQRAPYNRAIDLSAGAISHFGGRCPTLLKNIEIYQCPSK